MKIKKESVGRSVGVVDLFSGPGGLGEGFSAYETEQGLNPFQIKVSIEKEQSAHSTLLLRSFLRKFGSDFPIEYYDFLNGKRDEPDWSILYPDKWAAAKEEALCMSLGDENTRNIVSAKISEINNDFNGRTLLIGGPPCQAYSLVGRSRNAGKLDYQPHLDERNFLYEEYVNVLAELEPMVFVMENVKGMLSATIKGKELFSRVKQDLESAGKRGGYRLLALAAENDYTRSAPGPSDFIIRSENYSIPQARHRVIIVGIRRDLSGSLDTNFSLTLKKSRNQANVNDMISGIPRIRSGLSKNDTADGWHKAVIQAIKLVDDSCSEFSREFSQKMRIVLRDCKASFEAQEYLPRSPTDKGKRPSCSAALSNWITDSRLKKLPNSDTRGHMKGDLARYMFAAIFGAAFDRSPTASEFPEKLAPAHKNWQSGKFADRFRVQTGGNPSSTITSHISKDGNYYIHPDPVQCRTLTVREAARLQTFPDNYYFKGNRTQQYTQVGNAVPPYLARQIAEAIWPVYE